jgi:SAM-dependent methyltransferase
MNLCDYEGYDYRGDFWPGRDYEDAVERIALRKLLPTSGGRLVEIGAGFGPARSQLREAQERWTGEDRFIYVVGDIYNLPLSTSAFDVVLTVRVLHHVTDLPSAFRELHRILRPQGRYILEYANKRNLKAVIRHLLGRSHREPFSPQPVEYAPLHFNFHPSYIEEGLREAGFVTERTLAVSSFRLAFLKRRLRLSWLARLDSVLQSPTAPLKLAPSIFLLTRALKEEDETGGIFRCPSCGGEDLEERGSSLLCGGCGQPWPKEEGIYDFRVRSVVKKSNK